MPGFVAEQNPSNGRTGVGIAACQIAADSLSRLFVQGTNLGRELVRSGEFRLRIRDLQHGRSRHASRVPLAQDGDQHGLQIDALREVLAMPERLPQDR